MTFSYDGYTQSLVSKKAKIVKFFHTISLIFRGRSKRLELQNFSCTYMLDPISYVRRSSVTIKFRIVLFQKMRPTVKNQYDGKFPQVLHHFDAYKDKFATAFPNLPKVQKLNSPGLYSNFDKMITAEKPRKFYVNSNWQTIGFFEFLKVIPTAWSDKLRSTLMRLPK